MDRWAWEQLNPWLEIRRELPIGAVLCVIHGPTAGRHWEASAARKQLHHAAPAAGVRRRFAPHQLRHAHAVEDGARRCPARRDPAPTRTREPRHHEHLPPGDRQQRDHQHRPRKALPDDLRQHRSPDEAIDRSATGSARRSPGPTRRHTPPGEKRNSCLGRSRPAFVLAQVRVGWRHERRHLGLGRLWWSDHRPDDAGRELRLRRSQLDYLGQLG